MDDITIRRPNTADLPGLLEMIRALGAFHGDTAGVTPESLARDVMGDAPWLHVRVAARGRRLVAYLAMTPRAKLVDGERGMEVDHLYVAEDLRGRGLGRRMLSTAEALARELECSFLVVAARPDNLAAHSAYQAFGFERRETTAAWFRKAL